MSEEERRLEQTASAVEDLLYMGIIAINSSPSAAVADGNKEKALISPQFARIASSVASSMKINQSDKNQLLNLMYYSLLIYMNDHLRLPKSFTLALGNDLEKNRDNMECGEMVTNYVAVLASIWAQTER